MSSCQHDHIGRHIYMISQTLRKQAERILKPFDLTSEQFHILKSLALEAGRSQSELCELAGKSPANITRILDRLEKKGLIVRRINPDDRRSYLVLRTDGGELLVSQVSTVFSNLMGEVERGINDDELTVFKRVLAQIEANMQSFSEQDGE